MCCLRCAGAPRRPASGSALYLPDLSQHVVLYVPGEPLAAYIQFLRDAHWPSPGTDRLGTPDVKRCRGLLDRHCYNLLSCSPPSQETFTSELSTVWSPSPLSDMTTVATGQFPPAGLTPARSAASVAAPVPGFRCQFLSDMPSPRTPESSSVDKFQCNDADIGLRRGFNGSALPISPQSVSREVVIFGAT